MLNKILAVVAHPDDEILGMGGTILKHLKEKDEVSLLFISDGITSRGGQTDVKKRKAEAEKSANLLGIKNIIMEDFPDNQLDAVPLLKVIKKIENVILKMKPNIIYTHQPNDLNIDHQIVFKAVLTACRPQPGCVVKKILGFETVSSTEWQIKDQAHCFCPTEYVDILEFIERKIKILEQAYGKELRPYPHPRSKEGVKIFAQYRGLEVGLKFAEAFCLIRNIR